MCQPLVNLQPMIYLNVFSLGFLVELDNSLNEKFFVIKIVYPNERLPYLHMRASVTSANPRVGDFPEVIPLRKKSALHYLVIMYFESSGRRLGR